MESKIDFIAELVKEFSNKVEPVLRKIIKDELIHFRTLEIVHSEKTDEVFLSAQEAAKYLKRKLSTLYKDVRLRNIPYHKSGPRKLLFAKSELDNFILSKSVKSKDEIRKEANNYIETKRK